MLECTLETEKNMSVTDIYDIRTESYHSVGDIVQFHTPRPPTRYKFEPPEAKPENRMPKDADIDPNEPLWDQLNDVGKSVLNKLACILHRYRVNLPMGIQELYAWFARNNLETRGLTLHEMYIRIATLDEVREQLYYKTLRTSETKICPTERRVYDWLHGKIPNYKEVDTTETDCYGRRRTLWEPHLLYGGQLVSEPFTGPFDPSSNWGLIHRYDERYERVLYSYWACCGQRPENKGCWFDEPREYEEGLVPYLVVPKNFNIWIYMQSVREVLPDSTRGTAFKDNELYETQFKNIDTYKKKVEAIIIYDLEFDFKKPPLNIANTLTDEHIQPFIKMFELEAELNAPQCWRRAGMPLKGASIRAWKNWLNETMFAVTLSPEQREALYEEEQQRRRQREKEEKRKRQAERLKREKERKRLEEEARRLRAKDLEKQRRLGAQRKKREEEIRTGLTFKAENDDGSHSWALDQTNLDIPDRVKLNADITKPILTKANFENTRHTCPVDAIITALFKTPGTWLEEHIRDAKQLTSYGDCDADTLSYIHINLLKDIVRIQTKGGPDDAQECSIVNAFTKCVKHPLKLRDGTFEFDEVQNAWKNLQVLYNIAEKDMPIHYTVTQQVELEPEYVNVNLLAYANEARELTDQTGKDIVYLRHDNGTSGHVLMSVILHTSGHFITLVHDIRSKEWWYYDALKRESTKIEPFARKLKDEELDENQLPLVLTKPVKIVEGIRTRTFRPYMYIYMRYPGAVPKFRVPPMEITDETVEDIKACGEKLMKLVQFIIDRNLGTDDAIHVRRWQEQLVKCVTTAAKIASNQNVLKSLLTSKKFKWGKIINNSGEILVEPDTPFVNTGYQLVAQTIIAVKFLRAILLQLGRQGENEKTTLVQLKKQVDLWNRLEGDDEEENFEAKLEKDDLRYEKEFFLGYTMSEEESEEEGRMAQVDS